MFGYIILRSFLMRFFFFTFGYIILRLFLMRFFLYVWIYNFAFVFNAFFFFFTFGYIILRLFLMRFFLYVWISNFALVFPLSAGAPERKKCIVLYIIIRYHQHPEYIILSLQDTIQCVKIYRLYSASSLLLITQVILIVQLSLIL